jgi:tetratricopeptide (TPR) repeat protein
MTIKVLAETAKDKGRLLNQIVRRLLDELGYDDFRTRIANAGSDIEVRAKHRATQAPILCKARALSREIGPDELKRFLAAYTQGKKKDRRLVGLFLAFSGLSPTAREWYAGLEEKGKGEFHVFAPEKLLALLRRARLIGPPEVVEPAIKSRIRTDAGPRFLAFHEGQMYWVQTTLTGRKVSGFAVLGSHGELVSRVVARELKRLDPALEGKRLVDTYLRDKIFLALLDMTPRNLEALAKEVREPLGDVREVMHDLARENVVASEAGTGQPRWKVDRYSLRPDVSLFLSLARQYLEGPHKFRFLSSQFAGALFASDVPGYLEARWRFRSTDRERAGLFRFLSVSPSALNHALFTPTDRYLGPEEGRTGYADRERSRPLQTNRLIEDLLVRMSGDMEHPHFQDLLGLRGIKGHLFRTIAKAATTQELAFNLQADSLLTQNKAAAPGRPAQPGARNDAEQAVELGMALLHMEEHEQAVAYFDRGIKEIRDPSRLLSAWNSRGISLLHLKKYTEATNSFNEALRYNGNSKVAWYYKALCLKELGDLSGAQRCVRRALDIDPNYAEARDLSQVL